MRLSKEAADYEYNERQIADLQRLLEAPTVDVLRPCPGCDRPCTAHRSRTCTCMCSADCPHSAQEMSSEPERYPIEPRIASLVFAFNCLRVCPPYWSCEGHTFPNGELMRVPQVWFYSRSLMYPKLIGEYVFSLKCRRLIANPWHIRLSFAESKFDTGFSIEPDVQAIASPDIVMLQREAQVIADNFASGLRALARQYLLEFERQPKTAAVSTHF